MWGGKKTDDKFSPSLFWYFSPSKSTVFHSFTALLLRFSKLQNRKIYIHRTGINVAWYSRMEMSCRWWENLYVSHIHMNLYFYDILLISIRSFFYYKSLLPVFLSFHIVLVRLCFSDFCWDDFSSIPFPSSFTTAGKEAFFSSSLPYFSISNFFANFLEHWHLSWVQFFSADILLHRHDEKESGMRESKLLSWTKFQYFYLPVSNFFL